MDDPIKVIFKYKNNNARVQYHIYIYIGDVPSPLMSILKKIENLSMYNSLVELDAKEIAKLTKTYDDFWYKKFFNTHHINATIHSIRESAANQKELKDKLGKDWYKNHIEEHSVISKDVYYNYESVIKEERDRKSTKKNKNKIIDDDIDVNYTTGKNKTDITKLYSSFNLSRPDSTSSSPEDSSTTTYDMIGGGNGGGDEENEPDETGGESEESSNNNDEFEEGMDMNELLSDEEMDLSEIEAMYKDVDVNPDQDIIQTSDLIKKALNDDKLFKKVLSNLIEFDKSKDEYIHDEHLKNVFNKCYVTTQYIFKDDTVKSVKNKICCSIKNNDKFGKNSYIIPSRQYLWSEYYFDNKVDQIMIGQKWIKRNELLHIDVEPNSNMRIYEELRGNLKLLRDNIKRYGSKIKREDDDYNILYDYEGYFSNNELYMVDLYNEIGLGYNPDNERVKNMTDVFIRVYFPKIKSDDVKYILEYLNGIPKVENNKLVSTYDLINNDLILENEIMKDVEAVKKTPYYKDIFKDNYITQSVIHVNLRLKNNTKIDLFRIFNEFITSDRYPFVQYQTPDGRIIYKFEKSVILEYHQKKHNMDLLAKWFENAPYGISFKVKVLEKGNEKFMAINLNDSGRIEYKTQWKEDDMATIDDIKKTYQYVKNLIEKVNDEKNRVQIEIPGNTEFRYAFINTIQKFELPEKFIINHNDLSEFSRYFYPYVALVIEPRKRQSKVKKNSEKSKFGTYLRYKRVSKYENQARIEQRILYFMRNYDYNDQSLSNEISKQFNITEERAMEEIDKVRSKYTNIKKSRKILKKLENIPKYKPPGIGIDIQGKQRDKYKIRISGARDKLQLDRIIIFMNILIHLYIETYLYKDPKRQNLKEKLKMLTNIAKRRNKVDDIVNYNKEIKTVKQMTQLDKKRIGFKPEKGQNQWTRSCQNSGNDKKRRPQQYTAATMDELLKKGYILNKKTGMFERKVILKGKKGKKQEVTIRTVKLQDFDEHGELTDNEIHYACSPNENGDHMYVGFLTRSNNPHGHCMPCCFKKDPLISKNKEKRDYFLKCIGKKEPAQNKESKIVGDRLYILQDTNKIQEGRFGFLPKYLDYYFNYSLKRSKKIKHHYLIKTKNGYFFKYGSKQDEYPFLNAVAALIDKNVDDIKNIIVNSLEKDKNDLIFTALNNGDIKTQFGDKPEFIKHVKMFTYLDFDLMNHILSIPGIITKNGMNIIVFNKITRIIKKNLEKEKIKEDFIPMCQNVEEYYNIYDKSRDTVFILRENKNYYPIVLVKKDDDNSKTVELIKHFKYDEDKDNIVNHIKDYYSRNCYEGFIEDIGHRHTIITAKKLNIILNDVKNKDYHPKYQVIDTRNKCKYLVTNNSTIIPVKPSGSIYNMPILKNMDTQYLSLTDTIKNLTEIYNISKKEIPTKPIGIYYESKDVKNNKLHAVAVMTKSYDIVPIKPESVSTSWVEKNNYVIENKPLFDKIDTEIEKGPENISVDNRITNVNYDTYYNESYQLFRLEFSEYLNREENEYLKKKIIRVIEDKKVTKIDRKVEIKKIIYKLTDKDLYDLFETSTKRLMKDQKGGKYDRLLHVASNNTNVSTYQINNNRDTCAIHGSKDVCNSSIHCHWSHNTCYLSLTKDILITFVNKVSEELASGDLKAQEILKVSTYFVSDIVDYNRFTERPAQKIINSSNNNLKKILGELFGRDNIPKIGKRRISKNQVINYQQMNIDNPIKDMRDFYIQNIIENNLSIFRSYVNGFYWIKYPFYDPDSRNLGYYSDIQTALSNYFRSLIIDWLLDKKKKNSVVELSKYIDSNKKNNIIDDFIIKLGNDIHTLTNCIIELHVLSKIQQIPIFVYDDDSRIVYIFDNGIIYNINEDGVKGLMDSKYKKYQSIEFKKNSINLRFSFISNDKIPDEIETIYHKN